MILQGRTLETKFILITRHNRSDAPDDLIPQFDYIRKSVEAFNLPSIELTNYEADDLIATYSDQIIKKGENVTVVSSDKDLMQLYKKNLRIYDQ